MADTNAEKSPPEGAVFDRRYLLLGLVPVAVYFLLLVVLNLARPYGIEFKTINDCEFDGVAAAEAHLRYLWISAFLLSSAVSIAVGTGCALSLWSEMPVRDRRLVLTILAAVAVHFLLMESQPASVAETVPVSVTEAEQHPPTLMDKLRFAFSLERWYEFLGKGLYDSVFNRDTTGPIPVRLLGMLDIGLNLVKYFGIVALTLVTTAIIMTLVRPGRGEPVERQTRFLARALARQRTYLHQGAAVYVFALVAMLSWMYWPLPFLAGETAPASYRQLVVGAAVLQGVSFSLGIAAIYLPSALLLRRRVTRLAGEVVHDAADVEGWLREKGLETRPLDQLRQIAALLMPALVSVLPAVTELWR